MTTKGHGVIRGRRDLLYDPKGHGDLCGRFDLVYDPKMTLKTGSFSVYFHFSKSRIFITSFLSIAS